MGSEMCIRDSAKPQDRLKSAEELVEQHAERLRAAEEARQRRMRGEAEPEADHGEPLIEGETMRDVMGLGGSLVERERKPARAFGNDDDDEEDEEEEDEEEEDEEEENEEEEDEEEEDEDEEGEDVEVAGDAIDMDDGTAAHDVATGDGDDDVGDDVELEAFERLQAAGKQDTPRRSAAEIPALPFTFPIPKSHDELLDILEQHRVTSSQLNTVVTRIRTLFAPHLAAENSGRLQVFMCVLIEHLVYRACLLYTSPSPRDS